MSYNVRPIVACAYRGVFVEQLPSNALSEFVTIIIDHWISLPPLDDIHTDSHVAGLQYETVCKHSCDAHNQFRI
jgi:hypothetical protein